MLRRITALTIGAAALAVMLFAVPLGIVAARGYVNDERLELQRDAVKAASTVRGELGSTVPPRAETAETQLGVYDSVGRRRAGSGPLRAGAEVRRALAGNEATTVTGNHVVVAVPLSDGDRVSGAVLLRRDLAPARARAIRAWLVLAGIGALAVALAGLAAQVLARRLTKPVTRLTATAEQIGAGDLAARAPRSSVPELDILATSLNLGVQRVAELVERERRLSAEVSHQLRTPVAGLRLQLEEIRESASERSGPLLDDALTTLDRLDATIAEVIGLARTPRGHGDVDLAGVVAAARERWHGLFAARSRPLRIERDGDSSWRAAMVGAAAAQILDVLLDNAYRHGEGEVTVRLRRAFGALAVDVLDEGGPLPIAPPALTTKPTVGDAASPGPGMGLAFARRLAEADGARLMLSAYEPPTFTLLVPAAPTDDAAASDPGERT